MVVEHHYLHSAPDQRSRPACYVVHVASERVGCLWFGRPESTRCYTGSLTYGSLEDRRAGRATFDRWEVLNLSRLWLSPDVQPGGRLHRADLLPGFTDRKGVWRSSLASAAIRIALRCVGFDYLCLHPPVLVDEPWVILAVLSYCDTRLHRGGVYRSAGFSLARTNAAGIETWWTSDVAGLRPAQAEEIRRRSGASQRNAKIRARRVTHPSLFDEGA